MDTIIVPTMSEGLFWFLTLAIHYSFVVYCLEPLDVTRDCGLTQWLETN